jgi:DNA replication and repair protein RecF
MNPYAAQNLSPVDYRLSTVLLANYRNYPSLTLDTGGQSVVLTGQNGAGKTNILEAISLFAPGRGLRGAAIGELPYSIKSPPPLGGGWEGAPPCPSPLDWSIVIDLLTPHTTHRLGTGVTEAGQKNRAILADGNPLPQTQLADYLTIAWATPDMDALWRESSSARRKFLDRLVYALFPAHWAALTRMEKHRLERARLLEMGRLDDRWCDAVELGLARAMQEVGQNRRAYIDALGAAMAEFHGDFPRIALALQSNITPDMDAAAIQTQLQAHRSGDAASGMCRFGANRDDLGAEFMPKSRPVNGCSTGEQKMALLSILLAHAGLLRTRQNRPPILLLDEIAAHLDDRHRTALARQIQALNAQAFLTGADASLFTDWQGQAGFWVVQNHTVQNQQ